MRIERLIMKKKGVTIPKGKSRGKKTKVMNTVGTAAGVVQTVKLTAASATAAAKNAAEAAAVAESAAKAAAKAATAVDKAVVDATNKASQAAIAAAETAATVVKDAVIAAASAATDAATAATHTAEAAAATAAAAADAAAFTTANVATVATKAADKAAYTVSAATEAAATATATAKAADAATTTATNAAAAANAATVALLETENQRGKQEKLARMDGLTKLGNQNGFFEDIDRELKMLARYKHPAALAIIDIDDFKQVNDSLGHVAGNRFLKILGLTIRKSLRSTDIAARIGGDEFAILFPQTAPITAKKVIVKLVSTLAKTMKAEFPNVTISVGIAGYHSVPATSEIMLREADLLMYEVKGSGKNALKLKVMN